MSLSDSVFPARHGYNARRLTPAGRSQAREVITVRKLFLMLIASSTFVAGAACAATTREISPHPLGQRSVFSDRAIAERIAPVGSVCVEGEECGAAAPAAATASAGPRSGDAVYQAACAACHATGAAGAPKVGDKGAWATRLSKGMKTLVKNAIQGIGAMPPKGMCTDCSDEEIANAVEYMVEQSK